jgi:hypothetical protein
MITTLLARLLQLADALSYTVESNAPIVTFVDELDETKTRVFDQATTHEGNLRAAIRWCESGRREQA